VNYLHGAVESTPLPLTVITETVESPYVCCGYSSAHMACWTAKNGLSMDLRKEAHAIRAKGGRPHNAGSKASELRAGAKAALGITLADVAKKDIVDRLREGYAVVASIQYGQLPDWLKVQSNDFGHSVTLYGWRAGDRVGFFDPLWRQRAKGAWAPWTDIDQALWASGHSTTTVQRTVAPTGDTELSINTSGNDLTSAKRVVINVDTDIFKEASGANRIATAKKGYSYPYIGNPQNASRYAALIQTGLIYEDKVVRPTVLYVEKADAKVEAAPPVPSACSPEELLKAKQEEYDRIKAGAKATHAVTVVLPPRP
jgi:hypothetical protein